MYAEIELELWAFILILIVLAFMSISSFIIALKEIKAYKEAHKPKKDKTQEILNKLNNKIIDTQYQLNECENNNYKQDIRTRLNTFHYVKGMVEQIMYEEGKNEKSIY